MNQKKSQDPPPDFWMLPRLFGMGLLILPNGWLRMEPFGRDVFFFLSHHGLDRTLGELLPIYLTQTLPSLFGWSLLWSFTYFLISLTVSLIAARAVTILCTKLILALGFRVVESVDANILHPEEA